MRTFVKSPLFLLGLAFKIACLFVFGSHYLKDLFIPFLDAAVQHTGVNPWTLSPPQFFPYGSVLFAILYFPRLVFFELFGDAALGSGALGLFTIKAPLLILDVVMLFTLVEFAPRRPKGLLLYYWLNPVLFYITYVHGQLDIAAMTFCILAIHSLLNEKPVLSATFYAFATLSKFHVIIIAPLLLAFLWNRYFRKEAIWQITRFGGVWIVMVLAGFFPIYWASRLGYVTAASPEAFRIFATYLKLSDDQYLYFGVALVLAILGRLCISTRLSEEGLFVGAGIVFGSLLVVTHTMPGWYFWVYPFIAVFFSNYLLAPKSLHWVSWILYLCYFVLIEDVGKGLGLQLDPLIANNVFTLLQTSIAGILVAMWILSIRSEAPLAGRAKPLLIGIAGDSGTGKNTLSTVLADLLDPKSTAVVEGDDYHKWDRQNERWRDYTHLNPKANFLNELWEHTSALVSGKLIFHPHYDHSTGNFTAPREIKPKRNLIVQGLHSFYIVSMRDMMGLRIFLSPDPLIRLSWKIRRDVQERGKPMERVLEQIASREADAEAHIHPQRELADWIIEYHPKDPTTREEIVGGKIPTIVTHHVLWNDIPIGPLLEALKAIPEIRARVDIVPSNIDRVVLIVEGEPTRIAIAQIGNSLFPSLRRLTRGGRPPNWKAGHGGIEQLVALTLLQQRAG